MVGDTISSFGKGKWSEVCGLIPQRQAVAASEDFYDQVRGFLNIFPNFPTSRRLLCARETHFENTVKGENWSTIAREDRAGADGR